jgi:hypothetical protein
LCFPLCVKSEYPEVNNQAENVKSTLEEIPQFHRRYKTINKDKMESEVIELLINIWCV